MVDRAVYYSPFLIWASPQRYIHEEHSTDGELGYLTPFSIYICMLFIGCYFVSGS